MNKFIEVIVTAIVGVLILLFFAYPVMILWNNCLVPAVDVVKPVSWLQMFGISVLFNFLTRDKIEYKSK